jgi:hypothetical protein
MNVTLRVRLVQRICAPPLARVLAARKFATVLERVEQRVSRCGLRLNAGGVDGGPAFGELGWADVKAFWEGVCAGGAAIDKGFATEVAECAYSWEARCLGLGCGCLS